MVGSPLDDEDATVIAAALVCKIDVHRWREVKAAVLEAGGQIIYQRLAAPGIFLRIVEEPRP